MSAPPSIGVDARYTSRAATPADAPAIAAIYNEGIEDRVATFETEARTPTDIAAWFRPGTLITVAEAPGAGVVAFAASFPYSARPCYAGIGEFSVYVARGFRGRGAGKAVLTALIATAQASGLHKLTSRVFPENTASRALLKQLGFAEIGIHRRHGKLDGQWRDCVVVELLMGEGAVEPNRGRGGARHGADPQARGDRHSDQPAANSGGRSCINRLVASFTKASSVHRGPRTGVLRAVDRRQYARAILPRARIPPAQSRARSRSQDRPGSRFVRLCYRFLARR
jgi:phosphinothricin acetyltransferase